MWCERGSHGKMNRGGWIGSFGSTLVGLFCHECLKGSLVSYRVLLKIVGTKKLKKFSRRQLWSLILCSSQNRGDQKAQEGLWKAALITTLQLKGFCLFLCFETGSYHLAGQTPFKVFKCTRPLYCLDIAHCPYIDHLWLHPAPVTLHDWNSLWAGTCHVEQGGLTHTEICLYLSPEC